MLWSSILVVTSASAPTNRASLHESLPTNPPTSPSKAETRQNSLTHATNQMDNSEATSYLTSLLNKTLRVHTADTRIFVGQMKCTDKVGLAGLGIASSSLRYSFTLVGSQSHPLPHTRIQTPAGIGSPGCGERYGAERGYGERQGRHD